MGITFQYPEEKITGMKWLGRGPYRVWKNRLKGMQFGVWEKAYNNTVTGESWNYPESQRIPCRLVLGTGADQRSTVHRLRR